MVYVTGSLSETFFADGNILFAGSLQKHTHDTPSDALQTGSLFVNIGSADAFQTLGSVVVGAGSLTNPTALRLFFSVSNSNLYPRFRVSGASANAAVQTGTPSAGNTIRGDIAAWIGSPQSGYVFYNFTVANGNDVARSTSINTLNNFNPAAATVIIVDAQNANATADQGIWYTLSQHRG